ncbi:NAD-binding protein [Haladaptatus halobius]|uniref:NAD-binding protein n=1 Tax=Haladaptatus halobius TaxID=2884875 RepID=UPI001D0B25D1|nr:NAD-binding protein [Haladaptatus halobius]
MTSASPPSAVTILVLGGSSTGVAVVERVLRTHDNVLFFDPTPDAVEEAADLGATAEVVEITDPKALEAAFADVGAVELALVAVESDQTALLVSQLAKTKGDARTVIVLMHDHRHREAFEAAEMIPVCATTALADAVAATSSLTLLCNPDLTVERTESTEAAPPSRPRRRV